MSTLCVGICTYNRLERLKVLVGNVRALTQTPFELVVGATGCTDGTVEWCKANGITVFEGENRGIGWSKNNLIWWFLNRTQCEHLILLEDDVMVWEAGWEMEWVLASKAWRHVNWPVAPDGQYKFGGNTPGNPIRSNWFGGYCTITERETLKQVGYIDPRFTMYGGEHAEWTWRFYRLLLGEWGEPSTTESTVPCLFAHVGVEFKASNFKPECYREGMRLLDELLESDKSIHRDFHRNDGEKADFMAVVERAAALGYTGRMDFLAGERCPLCSGIGQKIGEKEGVAIRNCCGTLLAWAWESEREYEGLYVESDLYHEAEQKKGGQPAYWDRDPDLITAARERLRMLRTLRPKAASYCDVGAGTGAFLVGLKELGVDAVGYEINSRMVEEARKLGRPIKAGGWADIEGSHDVIVLLDVFEHLVRPMACLERLKEHLNPGGVVVIEMPEANCPQSNAEGMAWRHIRPRQHVCLYSEAAAVKLFGVCGYQVELMHRPLMGRLGKISFALRRNDP